MSHLSPHLNPYDYFLCVYVKDKAFTVNYGTVYNLKERIQKKCFQCLQEILHVIVCNIRIWIQHIISQRQNTKNIHCKV
jgi:hypothetical protein